MTKRSPNGDDSDEETQIPNTETNIACKLNDDESFDGMDIEDWLAKNSELKTPSLPPSIIEGNKNESTVPCSLKRTYARSTRPAARVLSHHSRLLVNNSVVTERDYDNDFEVPVVAATINHAVPTLMTNGDIFVPVICTLTIPKNQLLIDGVNVAHTKRRMIYRVLGCLLVAAVTAVIVAMIATRWLVQSGPSNQSLVPLAHENNSETLSPQGPKVHEGNLNWTIADDVIYESSHGDGISLTQADSGVWFLQSVLNRTDINLTYFQVSQSANLLESVDSSLIFKFTLPLWIGHAVSQGFDSCNC